MIIKTGSIKIYDDLREIEQVLNFREEYFKAKERLLYVPKVPALPRWTDKKYTSQGYTQNVFDLTCDCPDYMDKSNKYTAQRDVRRLCRHLYWKLTQTAVKDYLDDLTKLFISASTIYGIDQYIEKHVNGSTFYLGFKPGNEWINVYVNEVSSWERYSFNLDKRRWSYAKEPGEKQITELFYKK